MAGVSITSFLKRMKLDKMSLEEYIDYVRGKYKPKSKPAHPNFEWNASGGYLKNKNIFLAELVNIVLSLLKKKQCIIQANVNLLVLQ